MPKKKKPKPLPKEKLPEIWVLSGPTASGKTTVAKHMIETGIVDKVVSFRRQWQRIIGAVHYNLAWHPDNFKQYAIVNQALMGLGNMVWINLVEEEIMKDLDARYVILDCSDPIHVGWAIQKDWPMIVLTPTFSVQSTWFEKKYKKPMELYSNSLKEILWNKLHTQIVHSLTRRVRPKTAIIRCIEPSLNYTVTMVDQAIASIQRNEKPKVW